MDDEGRNDERERMDAVDFQTESLPENKQKSKISVCPFALLCLLAGFMICSCCDELQLFDFRWTLVAYLFVIPLILLGISCGLPYYKGKATIGLALLLNLFLWFATLVEMWSILSRQ